MFMEHRQENGLSDKEAAQWRATRLCHLYGRICDDTRRLRPGLEGRRQVHDLQHDALVGAGVEPDHIYEDAASGRRDKRPGLDAALKALRRGDALVI